MNSSDRHVGAGTLHELAPLYAVDALEPQERVGFEQHLAKCPQCRAEVAEYAEVGAYLAAQTQEEPPAELRSSVLAAIHGTKPGQMAEVASLDERRRSRRRSLLAAAAAAVLIPGIALGGWGLGVQWEQRQQEQSAAAEQIRENSLLSAPDVTTHRLDVNGSPATLVISQDQDAALFVAGGLPDAGEGEEYQLWLLEDDTPIPNVRFTGGDVRIWLDGDVSAAGAVAMTVEPAGGSEAPTLPILAVAEL
ncbi:anti-sigma factor [Arthrobacter sp. zg-Y750]|uniref:anti-sigma factor n=1 Tax=Arthrobacter sp. zg-Y750 TaxID=2894189 RepID=UPI002F4140BD|nr:anti-sigma factor [Arthrobacter sp. zg-Y750]